MHSLHAWIPSFPRHRSPSDALPCFHPLVSLSFVTEQVAEHTNGTIGALLNATFGNAPELLIATAALRSGFYRVVQLTMLGSMLTNLLFVFGMSCLVGGLRWQVQELRITSGNVSVGMLLLSVTGSLLPAALVLSGQLRHSHTDEQQQQQQQHALEQQTQQQQQEQHMDDFITPTKEELQFCRVNAFVMIFMYVCYLIFQLGTHKEEFDEEENIVESADGHRLHMAPHFTSRHGRQHKSRRNFFCLSIFRRISDGADAAQYQLAQPAVESGDLEMRGLHRGGSGGGGGIHEMDDVNGIVHTDSDLDSHSDESDGSGGKLLPQNEPPRSVSSNYANGYFDEYNEMSTGGRSKTSETDSARRRKRNPKSPRSTYAPGHLLPLGLADPDEIRESALEEGKFEIFGTK